MRARDHVAMRRPALQLFGERQRGKGYDHECRDRQSPGGQPGLSRGASRAYLRAQHRRSTQRAAAIVWLLMSAVVGARFETKPAPSRRRCQVGPCAQHRAEEAVSLNALAAHLHHSRRRNVALARKNTPNIPPPLNVKALRRVRLAHEAPARDAVVRESLSIVCLSTRLKVASSS